MKSIRHKIFLVIVLIIASCFVSCKSVQIKGGCDCPGWSENQVDIKAINNEQKV
jgi:hypothetical protein